MRKRLLLIVLFVATSFNLYSQVDTTFHAIKENTEKTALHTEKGSYEYVSISISILAFLVAGITLYFSVKTYRSQKKTELNTRKWSTRLERDSLLNIGNKIAYAYAIFVTMEKTIIMKKVIPTESTLQRLKIDPKLLHSEDNFEGEYDMELLVKVSRLLNEYNGMIDRRVVDLQRGHVAPDNTQQFYSPFEKGYYDEETNLLCSLLCGIIILYNSMWTKKERAKKLDFIAHMSGNPAWTLNGRRNVYSESDNLSTMPRIDALAELDYMLILQDYASRYTDKIKDLSSWTNSDFCKTYGNDRTKFMFNHKVDFNTDNRYVALIKSSNDNVSIHDMANFLYAIIYEVYENNEYDNDITYKNGRVENLTEYYTIEDGGTLYLEADGIDEFRFSISGGSSILRNLETIRNTYSGSAELLYAYWLYLLDKKSGFYQSQRIKEEVEDIEKKYGKCWPNKELTERIVKAKNLVLTYRSFDYVYEAKFKIHCEIDLPRERDVDIIRFYTDTKISFHLCGLVSYEKKRTI